jgi:ABC-type dipeptide/oligopeptide/nickel transport system ATPase component
MADQTVVMYLGKVVGHAPTRLLFEDVRHPYTKALFSAVLLARRDQLANEVRRAVAGSIRAAPWQCRAAPAWSRRCGRYRPVTA